MTNRSRGLTLLAKAVVVLVVAAVWWFALAITVPRLWPGNYDYGFFTAVAERLRAGDTLYTDVWDNKDPLVFYSIAVARTFGAAGAWALELAWLLLACGSTYAIARASSLGRWPSVFVGFAALPVATLGVPYFMGTSHLPGVALTLLAVALMLARHPVLAGVPVALLVFAKFVMLPLALALIVVIVWRHRSRASLGRFAIGLLSTAAALAVVLLIRGELVGFLTTQVDNILYSQSPIVQASYTSLFQKVAQHVVILINPDVLALEIASTVIAVVAGVVYWRRSSAPGLSRLPLLWWLAIIAFAMSGVIIAITGKWLHHAEIFVVSSALFLIVLVDVTHALLRWPRPITAIAVALAAFLLSGSPPLSTYPDQIRSMPATWAAAQETDELTALLAPLQPTSVAFVGWGNLLPRSPGLEDWTIACRHMAQRPFNPPSMFEETLACLPTAQTIVVTRDFERDTAFPEYVGFYDAVEKLLAVSYQCTQTNGFRVCTQR